MSHNSSSGILIYAFNNGTFDYVSSATFAAKQAKKFLQLPVTLITDTASAKIVDATVFDTVIVKDSTDSSNRAYRSHTGEILDINWLNKNRVSAYELSPYDRTLLIDADYFMYNSSLLPMFETDVEFACYDQIVDITGSEKNLVRISDTSIPMQWATVIYFKKSDMANGIFSFMEHIKGNWEYYSLLYRFQTGPYRNDFSLSVAVQALSGYTTKIATLPGKLHTLFSNVDVLKVTGSEVVFKYSDTDISKISGTNIHCINKLSISKFYE
jgi:hypothetical protein